MFFQSEPRIHPKAIIAKDPKKALAEMRSEQRPFDSTKKRGGWGDAVGTNIVPWQKGGVMSVMLKS